MANLKGFAAWAKNEEAAGKRLPYAGHADGRTIILRDGALMQCLQLGGFSFETADTEDLNHRCALRDGALRAIANSRYVIRHHVIRRRVEVQTRGEYTNPVCHDINARWHEALGRESLFVNELFLSIVRRPPRGKTGFAERVSGGLGKVLGADARAAALSREIRELDSTREALMAALQAYQPRLLETYATPHGECSEPLEFLSCLFNGELRPVLKPAGDAGLYIPYKRISFGIDALERKGAAGRDFAAVISFKEYPPAAIPGMLDAVLRLPHEIVVAEAFSFVERQIGLERISLSLRRLKSADDDTASLRQGLVEAKDDLASGKTAFGEHQFSLLVRGPTLDALDRAAAECISALADIGAIAVREDLGLEPAFWAQFPGNESYGARKALISTAAFASLASLHNFPIGDAEGNHWGDAISVLQTTSNTPYYFNFHKGDLGNFTIIGPSGSGKTVVLNFLTAQAQKLSPRTIFFDKDRGAELFLRGIGGHYASLRPGTATGFNPLQLADTPVTRAFLRDWLGRLVRVDGDILSPEEDAVLTAAIDANFAQEPQFRRLRYFRELLGGRQRPSPNDLSARLAPWCGDGERAWLFDNPADRLDLGLMTMGFDMTALLDEPVLRTPAMMYLFHRIDERIDGQPTLILIDEGWKALDDEIFAARIRDWMKTLRKRNAVLGFGTQSARDALDSRVSTAIIEQAATQIFMANPRAQAEDYCAGFGLTEHELALIRGLPSHAHCFLVKHANESVVVRLDLGAMPDLLTIMSGREESVRKLDRLRERHGDHPSKWWQSLTGRAYPGPEVAAPAGPSLRSVS